MSMYAYWLANTGLTVHKLTGLMTEGIGAEELYALQESQMKKSGFWMKRMWKNHTIQTALGCTGALGKTAGGRNRFCLCGRCAVPAKAPPDFCNTLCAVLYWQAAGRNTKECGNCRGADKKCLWKPDYGETGEGTCTEPDGYHQRHGDGD